MKYPLRIDYTQEQFKDDLYNWLKSNKYGQDETNFHIINKWLKDIVIEDWDLDCLQIVVDAFTPFHSYVEYNKEFYEKCKAEKLRRENVNI